MGVGGFARRGVDNVMSLVLVILYILAALPVLLVALVLLAATVGALSVRRKLRQFARRPCEGCGEPLGRAAVASAEAERGVRLAKIHAEGRRKGVKLRIAPVPLLVVCGRCGHVNELRL